VRAVAPMRKRPDGEERGEDGTRGGVPDLARMVLRRRRDAASHGTRGIEPHRPGRREPCSRYLVTFRSRARAGTPQMAQNLHGPRRTVEAHSGAGLIPTLADPHAGPARDARGGARTPAGGPCPADVLRDPARDARDGARTPAGGPCPADVLRRPARDARGGARTPAGGPCPADVLRDPARDARGGARTFPCHHGSGCGSSSPAPPGSRGPR
jgi:hypothetical protein